MRPSGPRVCFRGLTAAPALPPYSLVPVGLYRILRRTEMPVRSTIELSMVVKNGAAGLARCLQSVRPLVDRIVVGDTGSTDASAAIAKSFGAEVFSIPWTEDYAAARNRVLARAQCDWVLVLDADEELDASAISLMPALVENREIDAYQSWIRNYVEALDYRAGGETARANDAVWGRAARYPAYFRSRNTRLFRRDPKIYFEHIIHETVLDRLMELGRKRAEGPFLIHHFGYVEDAPGDRKGKTEFYRSLSLRKAAGEPRNSRAQLEMGMHEVDCAKDYRSALPFLAKACALDPASAPAWLYTGICYLRLHELGTALRHLQGSLAIDPENPLVHASLGDLFFLEGKYEDARACYIKARELGDASPLSLAKLGSSEVRLGFGAAGWKRWKKQGEGRRTLSRSSICSPSRPCLRAGRRRQKARSGAACPLASRTVSEALSLLRCICN